MAGGHVRFLAIGNPTDPTGEFARAYRSPDSHAIRIDALETPNLLAGKDEVPFLVSCRWVEEMRRKYGEGAPAWQSKVRGLFPDQADDRLISLGWVQAAFDLRATPLADGVRSLGVDVARFGSDFTTLYVVQGSRILHAEGHSGQDLMWTAGRTLAVAREYGVEDHRVAIDDTGVGGGVVDRLREQGFRVRAENFGSKAKESTVYADRRSEMWWKMRDWIRDHAALSDAPLRARETLREDLAAPRYVQVSDGRLRLESKSNMKNRLGHSPDDALALALALAAGTAPCRARPPLIVTPSTSPRSAHPCTDDDPCGDRDCPYCASRTPMDGFRALLHETYGPRPPPGGFFGF